MGFKIKPRPSSYFHLHAHSHYSTLDGMSTVEEMVGRVVEYKQPALALTDHGNMSGVFQLYKLARKNDLLPFPGLEAYLVSDVADKDAKRYHVTMSAFTTEGYKCLVQLTSQSHERSNYHYKPRIDFHTVIALGGLPGVLCTSGCWYGWPLQALEEHGLGEEGVAAVNRRIKKMASVFKEFHIEVQHHEQANDSFVAEILQAAAHTHSLPLVVTQDAHYCHIDEKPLHTMMKALAYGGDPGDSGFPGDSYHLASTEWVRKHYTGTIEESWSMAENAYKDLLNRYSLKIPFLDAYQYRIPQLSSKPQYELRKQCISELKKRGLDTQKYTERLEYEMDGIGITKFASYFLLIAEVCQWCRAQGIFINARGSANGSLVCWLMGITEVDSVKYKLTFDRFLTPDRVKPPDIDLDIEHSRREEVVAHLASKYEVVQIANYARLGYDEEGQGSIFRTYMASTRRRVSDDEWQAKYKGISGIGDIAGLHGDEYASNLQQLGDRVIYKSHGSHAAGYALGTKQVSIAEWMPTMLVASSDTRVTQMTMDDVEAAGFIKVDFLGLRTLTIVKACLEMLGQQNWDWIPINDGKTYTFLRQGRVETGIFQLEGYTAAKGCREIGVKRLNDIILVNALYRPAARDGGYTDMYLKNKKSGDDPYYPHPIWEKHLAETLGVAAYQEQVLEILRDLGMSAAEMNQFLTAVKAKHGGIGGKAIMRTNKLQFSKLCKAVGMSVLDIEYAWKMIEGFAAYGFNKAHATAYSLLSYRTAYLKVHHPLEYHTALLQGWAGSGDKEAMYAKETRRVGIPILSPDVNVSKFSWTLDTRRGAIRKGLLSIKGVGNGAAVEVAANAPYSSITDLIDRTNSRSVTGSKEWAKHGTLNGVLAALDNAHALSSLERK